MPGADDVGVCAKREGESSRRLDGVKCNCESVPSSDDRSAVFGEGAATDAGATAGC